MNWRRSEMISGVTFLCVVVGWIWLANTKVNKWDTCDSIVNDKLKGNEALDRRTTIIETKIDEMMEDVKYIRRHTKQ